jgi:hypothetical protein
MGRCYPKLLTGRPAVIDQGRLLQTCAAVQPRIEGVTIEAPSQRIEFGKIFILKRAQTRGSQPRRRMS